MGGRGSVGRGVSGEVRNGKYEKGGGGWFFFFKQKTAYEIHR